MLLFDLKLFIKLLFPCWLVLLLFELVRKILLFIDDEFEFIILEDIELLLVRIFMSKNILLLLD
jgi:hypothetical protein